jgi:hypothetical protein
MKFKKGTTTTSFKISSLMNLKFKKYLTKEEISQLFNLESHLRHSTPSVVKN